jgi:hypothetical protein
MSKANKAFSTFLCSMGIYIILTLPHLMLIAFDWGIKYPIWAILTCSVVSVVLSHILFNKKK